MVGVDVVWSFYDPENLYHVTMPASNLMSTGTDLGVSISLGRGDDVWEGLIWLPFSVPSSIYICLLYICDTMPSS